MFRISHGSAAKAAFPRRQTRRHTMWILTAPSHDQQWACTSEFTQCCGESDFDEHQRDGGDFRIKNMLCARMQCNAWLGEVKCASAPGRIEETDAQMTGCPLAYRNLLHTYLTSVSAKNSANVADYAHPGNASTGTYRRSPSRVVATSK